MSKAPCLPSKCNGDRPTCGTCAANNLACEYAVPEGMTPREAEKKRIDEITMSRDNLRRVFELLRSSKESESAGILRKIRAAPTVDHAINMLLDASLLSDFQLASKSIKYAFRRWVRRLKGLQASLAALRNSHRLRALNDRTFALFPGFVGPVSPLSGCPVRARISLAYLPVRGLQRFCMLHLGSQKRSRQRPNRPTISRIVEPSTRIPSRQ